MSGLLYLKKLTDLMPLAIAVAIAFLINIEGASSEAADSVPDLSPIGVTTTSVEDTYNVTSATTATKIDTPLLETPASIQVISHQILEDQHAQSLDEALVNASGVRSANIGWSENIFLRGFKTTTYFRDGFRLDDPNGLNGMASLSNIDSIEILKGPAAVLYGQVEPGGIVNLVTKQPLSSPYYAFDQSFGSWNRSITNFDATGPISADKTWLYRFNASYDAGDSWVDNVLHNRSFIAPTVQWKPSSDFQMTMEMSYQADHSTLYQQATVPVINNQFLFGSRSANPSPSYYDPNTGFEGLSWSYQWNDDWSVKNKLMHNKTNAERPVGLNNGTGDLCNTDYTSANPNCPTTPAGTWVEGLSLATTLSTTETTGAELDFTGHIRFFGTQHALLFGLDQYYLRAAQLSQYGYNPNATFVPLFSSSVPSLNIDSIDPDAYAFNSTYVHASGVYFQDQMELPGHVQVLAGVRYQSATIGASSLTGGDATSQFYGESNGTESDSSTYTAPVTYIKWTPRLAALWSPSPNTSLYISYSQNFNPMNNVGDKTFDGSPLKPEGANQYEIGIKRSFNDDHASVTLAWFDLTKTDMATCDTTHDPSCLLGYDINLGEVNSKGIELTLQGEITRRWTALLAYTYDDVKVTQGGGGYASGSLLPGVPKQMARLYSTYRFSDSAMLGWKVGGGLRWQASEPGAGIAPDSPSFSVVDLMASYGTRWGNNKLSFQLNVNNVLNKVYYTDSYQSIYAGPAGVVIFGEPRSVMGSFKLAF